MGLASMWVCLYDLGKGGQRQQQEGESKGMERMAVMMALSLCVWGGGIRCIACIVGVGACV